MSKQLLLVSIGPVQGFIAAARRTRDLWYGSQLLSDLGAEAAKALRSHGAELIMPAIGSSDDAAPNKLLATVTSDVDAADVLRDVRRQVQDYWQREADSVRRRCADVVRDDLADGMWDEQIDSFLEYYGAWCALGDDYAKAREQLEGRLAARKNLREFRQWRHGGAGLPKSSLDGARPTILRKGAAKTRTARRLRISAGEQLDGVGLVKRGGGNPDQFVPLANVAAAAWIDGLERDDALNQLLTLADEIGLPPIQERARSWVENFPYDAQVFVDERFETLSDELALDESEKERLREHADQVVEHHGRPCRYVCCLHADGDRVGELIESCNGPNEHRDVSAKLGSFAVRVRSIIERDYRGVLVYSGGDDILAFINVADAFRCADALQREFQDAMGGNGPDGPTLSVGLGVGHCLESMSHLLALGRRAEDIAKGRALEPSLQRNALAVIIDKRSGGATTWRQQWDTDPVAQMTAAHGAVASGAISAGKLYEMRRTLSRFPSPETETDPSSDATWARIVRQDIVRSLTRTEGVDQPYLDQLGFPPPDANYRLTHQRLIAWSSKMVIANAIRQIGTTISPGEAE